jgi:hypothetical protein
MLHPAVKAMSITVEDKDVIRNLSLYYFFNYAAKIVILS